ncbi:hypothetical protein ABIE09_002776 [Lysobacter enzymogenes]|uniref:hypothetical protein n=1 Tax=Lysobacter enzymogenes TaxID=69 RepID=UPI003399932D
MSQLSSRALFYIATLATLALYWAGLKGPFILDDAFNLSPLQNWLDGSSSAREVLSNNSSGMLGRPVSMASFMFSAATGGMHPFPFKFGNLVIHLACGLLAWQVTSRMLALDKRMAPHANLIGAIIAGLWLIHPLNVSTVLYAVQRMAQLSSLFTLVALWIYLSSRTKLDQGERRAALWGLFVALPLATLAGLLSKENAAVAPALCLVLELAYFQQRPRPRAVGVFYALFLLLPGLLVSALVLRNPDQFLSGYYARDFNLTERLLTQPRALFEYIGLILVPRGERMGVMVDDFQISQGLLVPSTTLLSLLGLAAITVAAIALRKRAPSFFAGWLFFLVGHGIESSFLPLEIYFEHRNYLPMIGLIVAVVGLWDLVPQSIASPERYAKAGPIAAALVAAMFAWVTWGQVQTWRSEESLADQALAGRPKSIRALMMKAELELRQQHFDGARIALRTIAEDKNQPARLQGWISLIVVDCLEKKNGSIAYLETAEREFSPPVRMSDALSYDTLMSNVQAENCGAQITYARIADSIERLLAEAQTQPERSKAKAMMRMSAATANVRADRWDRAQMHAEKAWRGGGADPAMGAFLARIYVHNGHKRAASTTLQELSSRVRRYETVANQELDSIRALIAKMP